MAFLLKRNKTQESLTFCWYIFSPCERSHVKKIWGDPANLVNHDSSLLHPMHFSSGLLWCSYTKAPVIRCLQLEASLRTREQHLQYSWGEKNSLIPQEFKKTPLISFHELTPQLLLDWIWSVLFQYENNLTSYFFLIVYKCKLDNF